MDFQYIRRINFKNIISVAGMFSFCSFIQDPMTSAMETGRKYIYTYPGMHEYEGIVLPEVFPKSSVNEILKFPFHVSDIVISTYPKSGRFDWLTYNIFSHSEGRTYYV